MEFNPTASNFTVRGKVSLLILTSFALYLNPFFILVFKDTHKHSIIFLNSCNSQSFFHHVELVLIVMLCIQKCPSKLQPNTCCDSPCNNPVPIYCLKLHIWKIIWEKKFIHSHVKYSYCSSPRPPLSDEGLHLLQTNAHFPPIAAPVLMSAAYMKWC